jgi:hypothetical protein
MLYLLVWKAFKDPTGQPFSNSTVLADPSPKHSKIAPKSNSKIKPVISNSFSSKPDIPYLLFFNVSPARSRGRGVLRRKRQGGEARNGRRRRM